MTEIFWKLEFYIFGQALIFLGCQTVTSTSQEKSIFPAVSEWMCTAFILRKRGTHFRQSSRRKNFNILTILTSFYQSICIERVLSGASNPHSSEKVIRSFSKLGFLIYS